MAQKINLDTLDIDHLNLYKVKAVKMKKTGFVMTFVGGNTFVLGSGLLLVFTFKDVGDHNPNTDQTPANIYGAITICSLVSIATGIPLMAIGSIKKERIEIALKKFDKRPENSMALGVGITLRF